MIILRREARPTLNQPWFPKPFWRSFASPVETRRERERERERDRHRHPRHTHRRDAPWTCTRCVPGRSCTKSTRTFKVPRRRCTGAGPRRSPVVLGTPGGARKGHTCLGQESEIMQELSWIMLDPASSRFWENDHHSFIQVLHFKEVRSRNWLMDKMGVWECRCDVSLPCLVLNTCHYHRHREQHQHIEYHIKWMETMC